MGNTKINRLRANTCKSTHAVSKALDYIAEYEGIVEVCNTEGDRTNSQIWKSVLQENNYSALLSSRLKQDAKEITYLTCALYFHLYF